MIGWATGVLHPAGTDFFFAIMSGLALELAQSRMQWMSAFSGVKLSEREAAHSKHREPIFLYRITDFGLNWTLWTLERNMQHMQINLGRELCCEGSHAGPSWRREYPNKTYVSKEVTFLVAEVFVTRKLRVRCSSVTGRGRPPHFLKPVRKHFSYCTVRAMRAHFWCMCIFEFLFTRYRMKRQFSVVNTREWGGTCLHVRFTMLRLYLERFWFDFRGEWLNPNKNNVCCVSLMDHKLS